jgi:hypothetical protein
MPSGEVNSASGSQFPVEGPGAITHVSARKRRIGARKCLFSSLQYGKTHRVTELFVPLDGDSFPSCRFSSTEWHPQRHCRVLQGQTPVQRFKSNRSVVFVS